MGGTSVNLRYFSITAVLAILLFENKVDGKCEVSDNGLRVKCEDEILGKMLGIMLRVNLCHNKPTVKVVLDIEAFDIHVRMEGDKIEIPVSLEKILVTLKTASVDGDVKVEAKIQVLILPPITIYSSTVRDKNCNMILKWFYSQSLPIKIGLGAAVFVFLILFFYCCCSCICVCCRTMRNCCCKRKENKPESVLLTSMT